MIASLAMYDRPEIAVVSDRFWASVRHNLGFGPKHLTRGGDLWAQWRDPDLLLAQTCGLPYRARLSSIVSLLGTPDYGVPGCAPGYYNSVLVARAKGPHKSIAAFSSLRLAFNDPNSQSGWAAPCEYLAARNLPISSTLPTGAHRASALAVVRGQADLAAIDAVTWRMMQRWDPFTDDLQIMDQTTPRPGLPLITAKSNAVRPLISAIEAALRSLAAADAEALGIKALISLPPSAYLDLPIPAPPHQNS